MNIRSLVALTASFEGKKFPTPFAVFLAFVVLVVLWSTWLVPNNNESVVIQRFGKHVRTVGPGGLHFKAPWPTETATTIRTTDLNQMEVGFRTVGDPADKKYEEIPDEAEMFTSDLNLAQIDFTAQYQKADAAAWLFHVYEPENMLRAFAESSIRNVSGGKEFDDVVTSGRGLVATDTAKLMQDLVDKVDMGVHIGQVNLQDAHPPKEVMQAYQDVSNARNDKDKDIQRGLGYYNQSIPKARADAKIKVEAAIGYKNQRIAEAKGEADRFLSILAKYRQAPEITAQRMRFETLNAILPGKDQTIDLGGKDSSLFKFFDVTRQQPKGKE